MGKPEGKRKIGRPRRRWEDNSKTDLQEVVWGTWTEIDLAKGRDSWRQLLNAVMDFRFP